MQQIYGPLIFDVISNLNVDSSSENYGKYYDTKLGLLWHKRAYECGIYYHPNNDAGGIYFRINGFIAWGASTRPMKCKTIMPSSTRRSLIFLKNSL